MHAVVLDDLEEYLSGSLEPAALDKIEAHLATCGACRHEVESMRDVSRCLVALQPEDVPDPSPGFYARVIEQVGRQSAAPTFLSSLFNWQFAFGRRVGFGALGLFAC